MTILDKQLRAKNRELTLSALREGRVPTTREIAVGLGEFIAQADGAPTFSPRFQNPDAIWDIATTNKSLDKVKFDLDIAFEEVVDQFAKLINRASFIELTYQSQKNQLDVLLGILRNLSFVTKNAEDNFFGVFDTFTDLSKVNQSLTTRDAVDLNEQTALLPHNNVTADRVDMGHLYSRSSWPVRAEAPDDTESETAATIVQNEPVANATFGLAFSDLINSWKQVVTTSNSFGATIEWTIPISDINDQEISISRISVASDSTDEMSLSILHSRDNVNFIRFPNLPEEMTIGSGKTTNLDFETTRVQYIRFRATLKTPSLSDEASYAYVFAFRNISFYKLGRAQQAELVSVPLQATGMTKPIDQVSLQVIESIPNNCAIDWFVAADDGSGSPREGLWRPISPIGRQEVTGIPKVVRFGEAGTASVPMPAPTPSLPYATVREHDYYRLTTSALDNEPLFGQSFLYRGENGWWRNKQLERRIRTVKDAFIDFNSGDVQKLYAVTTDKADIETRTQTTTTSQTVLKVTRDIQHDPSTMLLVAPSSVDPTVDQRPRHAIYRVLRFRDNMTISDEEVTLTGGVWVQMNNIGVKAKGTGRPVVTNSIGSVVYTEGKDYLLEEDETGDVLTGRVRRINDTSSNINDGDTVKISYELESDITYLVDAVRGPRCFLSKDLGTVPDQYFEVTYRFTPLPSAHKIRQSTVFVTSQFGETDGITYQEGPDYIVDVNKGTITRVPTGRVQGNMEVYADFLYQETPRELETFSMWVFVERRDPIRIAINPMDLDVEGGERVTVDGIDITRKNDFPELVFGWHQVVVRSRRPETVSDAAVNVVASLYDRSGDPVFVAGGKYFSRMTALRSPMIQRTYTQLTKNTPTGDHSFFAITGEKHVIINFEPGTTEEVYTYGLRRQGASYVTGTWAEEFRLEYVYNLDNALPATKLLVRAMLSRGKDTDGGITPKIYEYHARLG